MLSFARLVASSLTGGQAAPKNYGFCVEVSIIFVILLNRTRGSCLLFSSDDKVPLLMFLG